MTPGRGIETGDTILRYRIVQPLGTGGMGEVYLAEDTVLHRKIALKFLTSTQRLDASSRTHLLHEARAAAGLSHPYICQVHEAGEAEGRQFIAMEYVEGSTLRQVIAAGGLPLDRALRITEEIAEALDAAHRQGTIHRDLKPANVMVSSSGHIKVMDFGLATRIAAGDPESAETATALTKPGCIPGTLAYMSPEQLRGESLDARSDLFSLGVILYEMLTGRHPFQAGSAAETASAILKDTPPPVAPSCRDAPARLEEIAGKAMAKDRGQRYSTARELLDDIAALRKEIQLRVELPSAKRAIWRRPAVVVLTLLALSGGLWWSYRTFLHPQQTVLAFRARDWILIAALENQTGEEVFDQSLDAALTVGIEQSKYVNVFPRSRIPEALRRMGRDGKQKIDEKTGLELAQREGIKGLLVCSIARIGDTYSLTARLVDPGTQLTALTEVSRAANRNDVLRALDDLAKRVRKKLGESLSGMSGPDLPLPKATTASLEALKLFATARYGNAGKNGTALLEQAVQLDPDFALAHADLGMDYYLVDDRPRGEQHFQQALKLLNRLTVREQLWIQALVEDWRGDRDRAIGRYEAFVAEYPDILDGWFRLGWARMITGRREAAIEAFRRVLEIDPKSWASYTNIAGTQADLGRFADSLASYQKAFELNPLAIYGIYVNHEYGFTLVETGQAAKAEETFRMMLTRDDERKAKAHRSLALLCMYQGRYAAAVPHLKEAILLDQALRLASSELRDRLYLVRVYRARGMKGPFGAELAAAGRAFAKEDQSPDWALNLGKIYARAEKATEAAQVLQMAEKAMNNTVASSPINRDTRRDRALVEILRGEVELARSKSNHATEALELAHHLFPDPATLEPLAHAYREVGNREEAIRKYQELLARPRLGREEQEDWILSHYQLGRIFQEAGDKEKAREYYEKFLAIWKDGDPDLPAIVDAKARLLRLQGD
ncbi:MAG TPA: protein kinase [Candidatus Acidoferrales bacterium]|nr:protein kinase [Candidatus Acidoferrales bacterium]